MDAREAVVKEALSWLGTPYHPESRLKGIGCDCATFILSVYVNCGIFTDERLGHYALDWWKHSSKEEYLFRVLRHATKVAEAVCYRSLEVSPGNILLGRVANSKRLNHGCIITDYPWAIHSIYPAVCKVNVATDALWAYREVTIFDPFESPSC